MEETYIHVNQNLMDAFDMKITTNDTNTFSLETPHSSVIFENLTANENSQALAKSLDMETDFNDFGIGVFEKINDDTTEK